MSRRRRGNRVDGVLLLAKPRGISSQTAVSRVKRLFQAAKAGHTGTLDPLAEGLLPVCLGEATKFSQGLLDADKGYRAVVRLGVRTTTGDLEGAVVEERPVTDEPERLTAVLAKFRGAVSQIPPMYSALKRDGRPLYDYARAGEEVERAPRQVRILELTLTRSELPDLTLEVRCSKGTYIRVLAEDIGAALGCGAALAALTRTAVGRFGVESAVSFDGLEAVGEDERHRFLLPVDALVAEFPRLDLGAADAARLGRGQPIPARMPVPPGLARAYDAAGRFMGMVEVDADGHIAVRRLVSCGPDGVPETA